VVCELVVVRFRMGARVSDFSLGFLPIVVGMFVVPPFWLIVVHLASLVVAMALQRTRPMIVGFNLASYAGSTSIALVIFRTLVDDRSPLGLSGWSAAVAASAGVVVVGIVLTSNVERLRGRFTWSGVRETFVLSTAIEVLNATVVFLCLRIVMIDAWMLVPVAATLAAMMYAYRGYASLLRNHESLERLYDSTRQIERPSGHRASIRALLDQTLELLGADTAELAFLPTGEHRAMVLVAGRDRLFEELAPDVADRVAADRAASLQQGQTGAGVGEGDGFDTVAAAQMERQVVTAALQGPDGIVGSIRAAMNHGLTFSDADRQLLEMFANHASVALHNSRLIDRLRAEVAEREHEALHDALTALPNRVMFDLQTRQALDRRRPDEVVAVVLVDLDRFKEVNDTLGHQHGDELLERIANRLSTLASEAQLTVARLGGDEFAVLVRRGSDEDVYHVASRVKATLEMPLEIAGVFVDVGASLGVAVAPQDGEDATTLLQRADVAMYVAKADHRDIVFYEPESDPYSPERLSLAADLRRAVAAGDVQPHFQPVTSLVSGVPTSVEALARWTHPTFGVVPPDVFIPIAEQSGLIRELTFHMLDRSLEHVRRWRSAGFALRVAVNLSVRLLSDDDLVERIARHLDRAGVDPGSLTLEVTEGTIMADPNRAIAVLEELHALGIGLSIDDFGMGYSSLNLLKRMPVSQLKIDRSFVAALPNDHDDAVIVQSVVNLGHNLGMQVVAEGVESLESLEYLRDLGCDSVQGYYLSPPLPPAELLHWLRRRPQFSRPASVTAG
jgi:diguanylate cyclase (GGDEF)-like protein